MWSWRGWRAGSWRGERGGGRRRSDCSAVRTGAIWCEDATDGGGDDDGGGTRCFSFFCRCSPSAFDLETSSGARERVAGGESFVTLYGCAAFSRAEPSRVGAFESPISRDARDETRDDTTNNKI